MNCEKTAENLVFALVWADIIIHIFSHKFTYFDGKMV